MSVGATDETLGREAVGGGAYAALPRPFRWILAFPGSPYWLAAATAVVYLLVALSVFAAGAFGAAGSLASFWAQGFSMALTYALCLAWVPVAATLFVRGVERDARGLAPLLGGGDELCREALSVAPRAVWIGAGLGLISLVPNVALGFGWEGGPPTRAAAVFLLFSEGAVNVAAYVVMGWAIGAALRLSRITVSRAKLDVPDPRALAPLTRNGVRLACLWLVLVAIAIPLLLAPPEVLDTELLAVVIPVLVVVPGFALLALFLPTRGAHQVLRDAKRAELSRVESEISEARRRREDERLPGLLAWKGHIESLAEWPIDLASLRRVSFFLLLPFASWVGGALVERLVDTVLG